MIAPSDADYVPLRGLSSVRVKRESVIERLRANREGHRKIFEDALNGFHRAVIEFHEAALADARSGKKYTPSIHLPEPQDHTRDYDRVISLLEMSLDDELELNDWEFAQFVLDDWDWKNDFINTAGTYTTSIR